jgi:capsule polysaccharide export protein KpsE/RkpR
MLNQTSRYFIQTKTDVAATSVILLKREADSLSLALRNAYNSTAEMIDRTYNLNPSVSIQRSGTQFNQAKATAISAAYVEVMRNLEIAKINLQKETPLFRIIDEPELPLPAYTPSTISPIVKFFFEGFLLGGILVSILGLYQITYKKIEYNK